MNDVPSRQRSPQQPTPPAGQSVLRVPRAKAEELLAERIAIGRELSIFQPVLPDELERQVEQWTDFNRTWLDTYLGGEAADEYRIASTHYYGYGAGHDPARKLMALRDAVKAEVSKLQSIHDRLHMWERESKIMPSTFTGQTSPDAPIFIVHGTDTLRAESVARTVEAATSRGTIILREQPNFGRTLIEKFEEHAAEVSYAIIVLTGDDKGSRADETDTRPRARQNVIFEMGYFYGLIGRNHVSVLLRPGVEEPSDMHGIAYINFDDDGAWKTELFRELRHVGFDIHL